MSEVKKTASANIPHLKAQNSQPLISSLRPAGLESDKARTLGIVQLPWSPQEFLSQPSQTPPPVPRNLPLYRNAWVYPLSKALDEFPIVPRICGVLASSGLGCFSPTRGALNRLSITGLVADCFGGL